MTFYWSGKGGQPSWLWGGEDGASMYVYNPSNFKVAASNQLQAFTGDDYTGGAHYVKAIRSTDGWSTHLYMSYLGGEKKADAVSVNYANSAGSVAWKNVTGKPTFTLSGSTLYITNS